MAAVLTKGLFTIMLEQALKRIQEKFDYLNELDSATGDGDHGTAILSTMKAAIEATREEGTSFSKMLTDIGLGIMNATGGSTSSIFGSFYIGMGDAVSGEELNSMETSSMFEAGLANAGTMTNAKVGDKTMMDALIPAIEAMKSSVDVQTDVPLVTLFEEAAKAAKAGADSTKDLVAKLGRAKNLKERSIGHLDAGAVSQALLFESYAQTVKEN